MHHTHSRRRNGFSETTSASHYGESDVETNLPLLVSRVDESRSSHSRTHSRQYTQRSPRQEYPVASESSSRTHQRQDRWRQGEASSYSSNHNRYSQSSNVDSYDNQRRDGFYDRGEDRFSVSSSTRGWVDTSSRDYTSSSRVDRSWHSSTKYEAPASEYGRWEGRERERDVSRDEFRDSDRRRENYEKDESGRVREHGWQSRDQEWDRDRRQDWNGDRDSRSSWAPRSTATHAPPEDRTWKPAATWQSGERNSQHGSQMGGVYNKKNKKKPNQGQGRRTWQNNQNYKKPYDWRDGPSNWRDAPDGRNK